VPTNAPPGPQQDRRGYRKARGCAPAAPGSASPEQAIRGVRGDAPATRPTLTAEEAMRHRLEAAEEVCSAVDRLLQTGAIRSAGLTARVEAWRGVTDAPSPASGAGDADNEGQVQA
jgi:hypothetical protein